MTPEQTLRAAAQKVREHATSATPGPWRSADTHLGQFGYAATVLTDRENLNDTELVAWLPSMSQTPWDEERKVWPTAAYIALMHPGVGTAIAALLLEEADSVAEDGGIVENSTTEAALTIARQILGDQT